MKIAFLGGGALRLLGVLDAILSRPDTVDAPHIVLMDLDAASAQTMCDLAARMPSAEGSPATFEATDDLDTALDGADFVYCVIRVGGVEAMDRDKRIGARYGFHGHDDYGPSAVMLTARTVPVVLDITARMERLCPEARLLIFTNPIATLVDAVERYSTIRSVGLCPGVYNFAHDMNHLFEIGVPCEGLVFRGGGLNHLSWVLPDATLNGEPVLDRIMRSFDELGASEGAPKCGWDRMAPLIKLHGRMFLNNGHQHHFFYHDELTRLMAEFYEKTPVDEQRASSQHKDREVAERMSKQSRIDDFWEQPPLNKCAAHPMGEIGVQFMEAVLLDSGAELAVTLPNHGHIQGIMEGATVEAHSLVRRDCIEPLDLDPIPDSLKGLCQSTTVHQRYLVDASVNGDRDELLKALLCEPTIRPYERARPMFDELWAAAHPD